MIFIGIDPGDSMGLVGLASLGGDVWPVFVYQGSHERGLDAFRAALDAADRADDRVAVACERYVDPPSQVHKVSQPTAQKIVGAVEYECNRRNIPLTLQSPAPAHAIAKNDFLRAVGLYTTPATVGQPDADDVNMAMRHVVLLLATKHATVFSRLAAKGNET